jgi:hypothetical protein
MHIAPVTLIMQQLDTASLASQSFKQAHSIFFFCFCNVVSLVLNFAKDISLFCAGIYLKKTYYFFRCVSLILVYQGDISIIFDCLVDISMDNYV